MRKVSLKRRAMNRHQMIRRRLRGANDANGQRKHPVKSSANGGDAVKLAKTGSNVTPAIVATVVMVSSAIFGGSYARRSRRKA